jgi:hypothetical protein
MNFIKIILAILGVIFGVILVLWGLSFVYSVIWYLFWIGIIAAVGVGGYRLFRKLEDKALGAGSPHDLTDGRDINMSWDEYERKYLRK